MPWIQSLVNPILPALNLWVPELHWETGCFMATVLVITGDELSIFSLREILGLYGHQVLSARTEQDALGQVASRAVDLVLIDVFQEGLDSPKVARQVLSVAPRLHILGLTAYPKSTESLAFMKTGAHGLLRKPFEIGKVLQVLAGGFS